MSAIRLQSLRRAIVLATLILAAVAAPGYSRPAADSSTTAAGCVRPKRVVGLEFSAAKYPNIRRHFRGAIRRGWPRIMRVNRGGADARRERLLQDIPTRDGFDRDEVPAAVLRGRGKGLSRGRNPRGWKADVRYMPSSENRSHGASLGNQLKPYCNGTRVRFVFRQGRDVRSAKGASRRPSLSS